MRFQPLEIFDELRQNILLALHGPGCVIVLQHIQASLDLLLVELELPDIPSK